MRESCLGNATHEYSNISEFCLNISHFKYALLHIYQLLGNISLYNLTNFTCKTKQNVYLISSTRNTVIHCHDHIIFFTVLALSDPVEFFTKALQQAVENIQVDDTTLLQICLSRSEVICISCKLPLMP